MKPRMTEAQALRAMSKLPGFELDEDNFGYKVMSPQGLVWFRGAKLTDEGFESESFGKLNISEIHRRTADAEGPFQPVSIEDARRNTGRIEINASYAKGLSGDRLKEPVLMVFGADGWHIIDGAHRVYQLHRLRKKLVYAKVLRPEVIGYARIKCWLQAPGGEWVPHDSVSDAEVERQIAGGLAFLSKLGKGA